MKTCSGEQKKQQYTPEILKYPTAKLMCELHQFCREINLKIAQIPTQTWLNEY